MRITTYRDVNGVLQMMNDDTCLDVLRTLGRTFADEMRLISHPVYHESELMNGIAAYHILRLENENARLDAAYKRVLKLVTDAAFEMALRTA